MNNHMYYISNIPQGVNLTRRYLALSHYALYPIMKLVQGICLLYYCSFFAKMSFYSQIGQCRCSRKSGIAIEPLT